MSHPTLFTPPELTLPTVAGFLEQLLATLGPVRLDLTGTTEIDLAGLQLLIAAARDRRITFSQATSPTLDGVCRAAGINPATFSPGDLHV